MKILFSHGGVIKLFPIEKGSAKNYENMRKFVHENLQKVPPNFVVKYKDEEGDMVVIENNKDIDNLFDTKSADYVRASVEDIDAVDANSDVSDEESDRSEKSNQQIRKNSILRDEDSRLKSDDDQADKKQFENKSFRNRSNQVNNSIMNSKPKKQEQIFKSPVNLEEKSSHKEVMNYTDGPRVQPFTNQLKKTFSEEIDEKTKIKQSHGQRMKEASQRKQSQSDGLKEQSNRENAQTSSKLQRPNPEQQRQKPAEGVGQSILRSSKIGSAFNEKNVSRLVRTLFNDEFEQRLSAMIPKLMQKLKKEIRVTYPTLSSQPQPHSSEQPVQEEPQQPEQQKPIHPYPCTGCMKQVIEGIRYKCLQCSENFCQACQQVIKHPHNMLKMRFLEVKEQKPQKIIDPKIQFVNKCFYLASYFGGEGRDYTNFVERFIDMTESELFEEYYKKKSKKLKKRLGERLTEMTKKLGLYFGDDYLEYNELVIKNPHETFENLVGYVKECGIGMSSDDQLEEQSFSELSNSVKSSRQNPRSPFLKNINHRSTQKFTASTEEERQQFVYFVCTRYQISKQKGAQKLKFIEEYYNTNQLSLSLEEIKTKFCEEVEKSDKQEWKKVQQFRSERESV